MYSATLEGFFAMPVEHLSAVVLWRRRCDH
jgi:hypothetical protein